MSDYSAQYLHVLSERMDKPQADDGWGDLSERSISGQKDANEFAAEDEEMNEAGFHGVYPAWHKAAEADTAAGQAFNSLIGLKMSLDQMDEIPSDLKPLYKEIMKAMDAVGTARKHTTQVRGMVRRIASRR
jgi:hypothetical protein